MAMQSKSMENCALEQYTTLVLWHPNLRCGVWVQVVGGWRCVGTFTEKMRGYLTLDSLGEGNTELFQAAPELL